MNSAQSTTSSIASSTDSFGFELPDDQWLGVVRSALSQAPLGWLGEYELLGEIGRGAQGVVFKAQQPRTGRLVAIKRLVGGAVSGARAWERFEREVRTAAALSHPGVVTVHGCELHDGVPLLVMEHVDGMPVNQWARHPDRTQREIIELFIQLCGAVSHAHRHGVIHRDLKPSNVLVDSAGTPRVLDFGLVALSTGSPAEADPEGSIGFVGTAAYASPEQMAAAVDVDTRADVYAVGRMLREALTGSLSSDTDHPGAVGIGAELDAIVRKSLAADRDQRYQSVDALAIELRRHLSHAPVDAYSTGWMYQLVKLARRRPWVCATVILFVLAASGVAVVMSIMATKLAQQRRVAVAARDAEHDARRAAEDTANYLLAFLSIPEKNAAYDWRTPLAHNITRARRDLDAGRFKGYLTTEAELRSHTGRGLWMLGRYAEAEVQLKIAVEKYEASGGLDNFKAVRALRHYGNVLAAMCRYDESEAMHRRTLALREVLHGPDSTGYANVLGSIAFVALELGRVDEAEELFKRTLEIREADDDEHWLIASSMQGLGLVAVARGNIAEGERLLEEGLKHLLAKGGPNHTSLPWLRSAHAQALAGVGRLDDAETQMAQALQECILLYGRNHADSGYMRLRMGCIYERRRNLKAAEAQLQRSADRLARAMGVSHPETARARIALGRVLTSLDRANDARELLIAGTEALEQWPHARGWECALARVDLAACYAALGEFDRANEELRTARAKNTREPANLAHPDPAAEFESRAAEVEERLQTGQR